MELRPFRLRPQTQAMRAYWGSEFFVEPKPHAIITHTDGGFGLVKIARAGIEIAEPATEVLQSSGDQVQNAAFLLDGTRDCQ